MGKNDGWLGGEDKDWFWKVLAALIVVGGVVSFIIGASNAEPARTPDWSDYALEEQRGAGFEPYDGR